LAAHEAKQWTASSMAWPTSAPPLSASLALCQDTAQSTTRAQSGRYRTVTPRQRLRIKIIFVAIDDRAQAR
jgi:hypothetical protein